MDGPLLLVNYVARISPDWLHSFGNIKISFKDSGGRSSLCRLLQCKDSNLEPLLILPSNQARYSTIPGYLKVPFVFKFKELHSFRSLVHVGHCLCDSDGKTSSRATATQRRLFWSTKATNLTQQMAALDKLGCQKKSAFSLHLTKSFREQKRTKNM